MIVVDTCVWSLAFWRQKRESVLLPEVQILTHLICAGGDPDLV